MRKLLMTVLCAALIVLGVVSGASALTINAGDYNLSALPSTYWWAGPGPANKDADDIAVIVGLDPGDLSELYKQNVGAASATGLFASSYVTTFSNTPADPSEADIVYVAGKPVISSDPLYLFVKDGNHSPGWYLFDLNYLNWNGTETIELINFWPGQGAISHIAIYGNSAVPIPGAVWLLGSGLIGLVGIRRRFVK